MSSDTGVHPHDHSCPQCGQAVHPISVPVPVAAPAREGLFLQTMNVGCVLVFSAVVALILLVAGFVALLWLVGVGQTL